MLRRQSDTRRDKTAFALNHRYDNLLYGSTSGVVIPSQNDFRLTLASGNPVYAPQPQAPTSTNTGTGVVTFANPHRLVHGTVGAVSATGGGLNANTRYYIHAASPTTASFHTTVALALSGSSPVTLTGSITATVQPTGVSNTSIYWSPYKGQHASFYNGVTWDDVTSGEISLALGTLTSGAQYTIFGKNSGGTPSLSLGSAWSSGNPGGIIPPDCATQDGVVVKSADHTYRALGVLMMNSTTTTIDDGGGTVTLTGAQRFLWNQDHRVLTGLRVIDTSSATLTSTVLRVAHNNNANKVEFVTGAMDDAVDAFASLYVVCNDASGAGGTGIGLDSTSAFALGSFFQQAGAGVNALPVSVHGAWNGRPSLGYHQIYWMESTANAHSTTLYYAALPTVQGGLKVMVRM